jgi:hypothetical protein
VFYFLYSFVWNISHSNKKRAIYDKNIYLSKCKVPVILEFSGQMFEKSSDIKFHENPSSRSRVVPCRQTDRHDEANSRFSQFCERA